MHLFLTMLPLYLVGNLHCAGMCGPLVLWLGKHRFRWYYFVGRLGSFSIAGLLSAEMGSLFQIGLSALHLSALLSVVVGIAIGLSGLFTFFQWSVPGKKWMAQKTSGMSMKLATLMSQNHRWPTFLFGFFTLLLPCGQTLVVFSACAIEGDLLTGVCNGFLFAALTTPSLIAAMHATRLFNRAKASYHLIWGIMTVCIGLLACLRGLADFDLIPHTVFPLGGEGRVHLVLF